MRRGAVLLAIALLGLTSAGMAEPRAESTVAPPGWTRDDARSRDATSRLIGAGPFGARDGIVGADVYVPAAGSIVLVIVRARTSATEAERAALVREAVDGLRAGPDRAALAGGAVQITRASVDADPATRVVVATAAWTDPAAHLDQTARLVLAASATTVEATTGECLVGEDAAKGLAEACRAAIDRLDSTIGAADRVGLALPAAAPPDRASELEILPDADDVQPAPPAGATDTSASRMSAGPGGVLMTMAPVTRPTDRRPIYLGLGVIVLAAVFWWNRQRRDRFDADAPGADARGAGPRVRTRPRPGQAPRPGRDDDADDLAAAARGDAAPQDPEEPA